MLGEFSSDAPDYRTAGGPSGLVEVDKEDILGGMFDEVSAGAVLLPACIRSTQVSEIEKPGSTRYSRSIFNPSISVVFSPRLALILSRFLFTAARLEA